ncbi:HlyD family secretion protein [Pedobacter changchengzhani]|uniref:HlyD family secretion protein n=1 Tax=Pedobacter changchengzhani TaxID=2529274 RepID=A0A4V3A0F5_9SPHI|nr:HlyD family secretion protein [Pedobacter changchengzhani]TDG37303.1 HlyD family secretion protein [Pedobacter changchengzhani]
MTTEKKKKNIVVPIILCVLLLIGIVFGIKEWSYYSKHVDTDDAQIDGDISPVVARVGGYVASINFEENTHVAEGQVLVKLDDSDFKVKLEQAQSGQKGASAGVGVVQSQIIATQANTSTAKANVEAARVKLNLTQKDYARFANLVKDGSITKQAFDQAKAAKESAQAAYQAAQDQYTATVKQVGASQSQLAVSNSVINQRQSDIDYAKLQLSYTEIKAPASGIVSKKNVQKGQLIQAGQSLFSVVNDGSIYVTANFKETQLEKIKKGSKVEVEVDAYPNEKIEGEVYNFSPITGAKGSLLPPDNATGNFVKVVQRIPVKIKIHPSKELLAKLRPGMSVKASVSIN